MASMGPMRHRFKAMGGPCDIQVVGVSPVLGQEALAAAQAEIVRIETRYSRYRPDSIVSRINAAAGREWTDCDAETQHLLDLADLLFRRTDGLFDATSGVLRRVWRFAPDSRPPAPHEVQAVLGLVGWGQVERQGGRVRLAQPGMEIDFGGFGKEFAVDRVVTQLQSHGIEHGLVNLAGDIRVWGGRVEGQPWSLGIQHPRDATRLLAQLPLVSGALATSGDYERYLLDAQGRRHCHILHPKTGWPAYGWQSISVVAPMAVVAGGLSTAAMLMGGDATAWLDEQGVDYLAVDADGRMHPAPGAGTAEAGH